MCRLFSLAVCICFWTCTDDETLRDTAEVPDASFCSALSWLFEAPHDGLAQFRIGDSVPNTDPFLVARLMDTTTLQLGHTTAICIVKRAYQSGRLFNIRAEISGHPANLHIRLLRCIREKIDQKFAQTPAKCGFAFLLLKQKGRPAIELSITDETFENNAPQITIMQTLHHIKTL